MVRKSSAVVRQEAYKAKLAQEAAERKKGPQKAAQELTEGAETLTNPTDYSLSDTLYGKTPIKEGLPPSDEGSIDLSEDSKPELTPRQKMLRDRELPETD
jgi:hypothetical protein